jgi:hypothetical protein
MMSLLLAKLYVLILEKKISSLLEIHDKRAKGKLVFEVFFRP